MLCLSNANGLLIPDSEPLRMCEKSSMAVVFAPLCFLFKTIFSHTRAHNLTTHTLQGDVLLVADEFEDGWMRGLKLGDLEVTSMQRQSSC